MYMFAFLMEFVQKIKNYFVTLMKKKKQQDEEHTTTLLRFYNVDDGYASLGDILEEEVEEV